MSLVPIQPGEAVMLGARPKASGTNQTFSFNKSVVQTRLDVPYLLNLSRLLHVDLNSGLHI